MKAKHIALGLAIALLAVVLTYYLTTVYLPAQQQAEHIRELTR